MKSSSTEQPVDQISERWVRLRIVTPVFVLVGLILVGLSVLLPLLMLATTEHQGVVVTFMSGYVRTLSPFITDAAMASSFIAGIVLLSFEKSRPSAMSVLLGALTLSVLIAEIALSLYLSIVHPLRATGQSLSGIYTLIGLVPLGLACTMFTIASVVSNHPKSDDET
jgi:hypothetical protein